MFIHISNPSPPFQARSFSATSLYVLSIYYLILEVKVSFFPFHLSPTIRIFFFLVLITKVVSGLVRLISGLRLADVKKKHC